MKFINSRSIAVFAAIFVLTLAGLNNSINGQTTYTTGFESPTFTLGDINGQNGWGYLSNSPTKGIVEAVPAGSGASFGAQSLAVRTNNVDFFGVSNHFIRLSSIRRAKPEARLAEQPFRRRTITTSLRFIIKRLRRRRFRAERTGVLPS